MQLYKTKNKIFSLQLKQFFGDKFEMLQKQRKLHSVLISCQKVTVQISCWNSLFFCSSMNTVQWITIKNHKAQLVTGLVVLVYLSLLWCVSILVSGSDPDKSDLNSDELKMSEELPVCRVLVSLYSSSILFPVTCLAFILQGCN